MKKINRKLALNKESIRQLSNLERVQGGEPIGSIEVCPPETAPACTASAIPTGCGQFPCSNICTGHPCARTM